MSNGHACCILGICCPPGGAEQRAAMEKWIRENFHSTASTTEAFEHVMKRALDKLPWKKEA